MSLQVFFDNTLIDEKYYTGLNNNFELFSERFSLGATPSNMYKLIIAKEGVLAQPTQVILKDSGVIFATLEIDNIEEDDYTYVYTLTDKMVDLGFYYDASEIFDEGSATLLQIAQDICSKVGLSLGTTNFRGYNKSISWYDNTKTAREYIGYIAELNGGFARIKNNILYFIKQKTNSKATISIDDCEDFNIGEYRKITRVVYELGTLKYEFGDDTGNTVYIDSDNVFITEESEVEGIYNDIKDFEFYSFTTGNCPIDYSIMAGDIITFTDGVNNYSTIAQYDLEYFGGWIGGYSLDINTEKQEETQIIGEKENIKNLRIVVDRENNSINQIIQEIGDRSSKTTTITQDIDGVNSRVDNIIILTNTVEATNRAILPNAATTTIDELIITGEIAVERLRDDKPGIYNLAPMVDLAPTATLTPIKSQQKSKALYFGDDVILKDTNLIHIKPDETSEEIVLPDFILRQEGSTSDELVISGGVITLVRKIGIDEAGFRYILPTPIQETLGELEINLQEGDNTIYMKCFNNAHFKITYITKNDLTENFATKVEMHSEINQTASEINLSVDEKLTGYSTTEQMNSAIDIKADQITSSVSHTLEDYSTTTQMNSAITQSANQITSTVNQTLTNYSTTTEMNSAITQSANQITSTVSSTYETKSNAQSNYSQLQQTDQSISSTVATKVGNNEVISKINQSSEQVQINANKISLSRKNNKFNK